MRERARKKRASNTHPKKKKRRARPSRCVCGTGEFSSKNSVAVGPGDFCGALIAVAPGRAGSCADARPCRSRVVWLAIRCDQDLCRSLNLPLIVASSPNPRRRTVLHFCRLAAGDTFSGEKHARHLQITPCGPLSFFSIFLSSPPTRAGVGLFLLSFLRPPCHGRPNPDAKARGGKEKKMKKGQRKKTINRENGRMDQ